MSSPPIFNGLFYVLLLIPLAFYGFFRHSQLPLVNGRKPFEFGKSQSRKRFWADAGGLIESGLQKANVFRMITHNGSQIVLAPKFAHEIGLHPQLDSTPVFMREHHSHIAGFEVFREIGNQGIPHEVIRMKLTRNLAKLTQPLATESPLLLKEVWTDKRDWHAVPVRETVTHIIARLSAFAFVGDELSRNEEWQNAVISYTNGSFLAAQQLNMWPKFIRPIVARFDPLCRNLRRQIACARALMNPVLQKRAKAKENCLEKEHLDTLQWLDDISRGRKYDPVLTQLFLALASINTSSDFLCQALYDICSHENKETLVQELRTEIISAIGEGGWGESALQKLKLMDSVLKESQRLKPIAISGMFRQAAQDIELSDGSVIPKGAFTLVANFRMWDSDVYPNPNTFDPYRFLRLREAGDSSAYLVSPSPEHMGFSYGNHACPGRFFAANEVKILLAHMILKYDIQLVDGCTPTVLKVGIGLVADPTAKLAIRRRQEEIPLDIEASTNK